MGLGVGGDVVARVKAVVDVDTTGLNRGLKEAEQQSGRTGRALHTGLRVAAIGAAGAIGIATAAIGGSVKAAVEAQVEQAKLQKAVTNAGISWKKQGGQTEDTLSHMAEASGFMKGDLSAAYSKLITVTKSTMQSQKLLQQAMDISRATGKPLTATTLLVSKAYDGSATALSRMGIVLPKITKAQDALKASGVKATAQQVAAAKAADLRSQREANLAAIQKKFGGQSAAYANTAAGQWDRFHSTLNVVEEDVGKKLLPVLSGVLGWLLKIAQSKQTQAVLDAIGQAFSYLAGIVKQEVPVLQTLMAALTAWYDSHAAQIQQVIRNIGAVVKWLAPFVKQYLKVLVNDITNALHVIRDVVNLVLDLLTGKWGKAWGDMKQLVSDYLKLIIQHLEGMVSLFGNVAGRIGNAIWDGIIGALKGIGNALLGVIKGAINVGVIGPFDSAINFANAAIKKANDANIFSGATGNIPSVPLIPRLARGGFVPGAYNGGRDSVLAMLSPGEMVLNRPQQSIVSQLLGGDVGKLLGFAGGGIVPAGGRSEVHVHQTIYTQTDDQGVHMRRAQFAAQAAFGG